MKIHGQRLKEPIVLTLELSLKEAMALRAVFGNIAGLPNGPRGMMDNIDDHLEGMGVPACVAPDIDEAITMHTTWDDVVPDDPEEMLLNPDGTRSIFDDVDK